MFKHKKSQGGTPCASPDDIRPRAIQGQEAVFLGWQATRSGEVFAHYTFTAAGHPSFGSTVTDKSLRKLNQEITENPPPQAPMKNT